MNSKGGSNTTTVKLPPELQALARENIEMAKAVSSIGHIPYQGPTVAGLTAPQVAGMQNTANAATAFGLPGGSVLGQSLFGANPVSNYTSPMSPYPLFQQMQELVPQGQRDAISQFFIDPVTGAPPAFRFAPPPVAAPVGATNSDNGQWSDNIGPRDSTGSRSYNSFGAWRDGMRNSWSGGPDPSDYGGGGSFADVGVSAGGLY